VSLPSPTTPESAPSHPLGAWRATLAEATGAFRRRYAHDASHEAPESPGSPGPDTHDRGAPQPKSRRARLRRLTRRALIALLVVAILGASGLTWAWQATPSVVGLPAWVRGQDAARHAPYTPLAQVSPLVTQALVAIEDERFYQHHGIDTIGLLRAAWDDLRAGHIVEGGSTLTAQLAKNAYLHDYDRTLPLKAEDLLLAVKIERIYSKQQILEYYLNLVYFGEGAYGIGAAAQRYFGERASQLDLAQAALVAGLVQAPGYYDPWCHPEAAQDRQRTVLAHMLAQGMITQAQDQAAQHESFTFWAPGASRPHDVYCAA